MEINRRVDALTGDFKKKVLFWMEKSPKIWETVVITETFRTTERQQMLFRQKKTPCNGLQSVSEHQSGNAFDIMLSVKNYSDSSDFIKKAFAFNDPKWDKFAKEASEYGIDWLYYLVKRDKPHFQNNYKVSFNDVLEKHQNLKNMNKTTNPIQIKTPKITTESIWLNDIQENTKDMLKKWFRAFLMQRVLKEKGLNSVVTEKELEELSAEVVKKDNLYNYSLRIRTQDDADIAFRMFPLPDIIEQKVSKDDPIWGSLNTLAIDINRFKELVSIYNSRSEQIKAKGEDTGSVLLSQISTALNAWKSLVMSEYFQIATGKQEGVAEKDEEGQV